MMFMNEYDVEEMVRLVDADETPNLARAASVLSTLVDWANSVSDGWPYWTKPARAARKVQEMLHDREYAIRFGHHRDGTTLHDVSETDLRAALAPIKRLLTEQGVDWNADLPWAAILPAAA